MDGLGKILNTLKTTTENFSAKLEQVKKEGIFGSRKVVVGGGQTILRKDLVPLINAKMDGLIKKWEENPTLDFSGLNNIHEEVQVLHEIINTTKLNRLEKSCVRLFSKIFGRSESHQKIHKQDLSHLSHVIQLKMTTIVNSKSLILDKNPGVDVKLLKTTGILNIASDYPQIEIELLKEINKLPAADQILAKEKLAILKEMVEYASALKNDHFKPKIIEKLTIYRIELKNEGISASFPENLGPDPSNPAAAQKGLIVDSNGTPFDNLRYVAGRDSATEKFAKFSYDRGGDYRVIKQWYESQAKDSWSFESHKVKNTLASFRNVSPNKIWGGKILEKALGGKKERESLLMFMAFTTELLTKTDFPGKNSDGTITIYRTESKEVLEKNGIHDVSDTKEHIIKRGFAESGSIIAPYTVNGTHVTEQRVPIHRVVGTFLTERLQRNYDGSEPEKEFICMFDDIPFKYTQSL